MSIDHLAPVLILAERGEVWSIVLALSNVRFDRIDFRMDDLSRDPCPCESGLSAAHCCNLDPIDPQIADAAPAEDVTAMAHGAVDAMKIGDRATAETLSLSALEQAPRVASALAVLADVRLAENKTKAATALLNRLINLDPRNFWAVNKLTLLELRRGNFHEAERHARHAVRIAPDNPQSHNLMGVAMTDVGRPAVGEYHHRKALELSGRRIPMILSNLALNLKNQGRMEEARTLHAEADAIEPDVRQNLLGWAKLEEADRRLDAATQLLDRIERLEPPSNASTLVRATVLGRQGEPEAALALLTDDGPARGRPAQPSDLLERGRLLDRLGRYDEAWTDFMAGKASGRERSGRSYPRDKVQADTANLKAFFTRQRLDLLPRADARRDRPQPIFVLGFPRSGTTLVEQILSVSPMIDAGDELPFIDETATHLPRLFNSPWEYPGALTELWMGDQREGLETARDYYLERVRQIGVAKDGARLFTDKMPLNETHLGLIGLIFPQAPLVYLTRHPLDIMVSAMSNFFTHGSYCGTTLETAAEHLLLTRDLVDHYRREMDLKIMDLRYEDLVDDHEATVRTLFDHVGVPFEPAALNFERNVRFARTASYAQVTEKLYDRSRYRYRNYLKHLGPAIEILRPLIDRLGYTIEPA